MTLREVMMTTMLNKTMNQIMAGTASRRCMVWRLSTVTESQLYDLQAMKGR